MPDALERLLTSPRAHNNLLKLTKHQKNSNNVRSCSLRPITQVQERLCSRGKSVLCTWKGERGCGSYGAGDVERQLSKALAMNDVAYALVVEMRETVDVFVKD
jgi:hypothetical protein